MEPGQQQILGGPVWFFLQVVILFAFALAIFVLFDSMRPSRRTSAAGRVVEPLWVYTAIMAVFLGSTVIVQFVPGLQLAALVPSLGTPLIIAAGVAYLMRVVYPKPTQEQLDESAAQLEQRAQQRAAAAPVEAEEAELFDE